MCSSDETRYIFETCDTYNMIVIVMIIKVNMFLYFIRMSITKRIFETPAVAYT